MFGLSELHVLTVLITVLEATRSVRVDVDDDCGLRLVGAHDPEGAFHERTSRIRRFEDGAVDANLLDLVRQLSSPVSTCRFR